MEYDFSYCLFERSLLKNEAASGERETGPVDAESGTQANYVVYFGCGERLPYRIGKKGRRFLDHA